VKILAFDTYSEACFAALWTDGTATFEHDTPDSAIRS
jgi:tRNA A37 threonylcarbamoyladenosine modification protein TsaB